MTQMNLNLRATPAYTDMENCQMRLGHLKGLIDEEGWDEGIRQELMVMLALARHLQNEWKDLEERIKGVKDGVKGPLWDAYQRGDVPKTDTLPGVVKVTYRDAGKPKGETIPAHYELDTEMFWDEFEPASFPGLIEKGIIKWVPREKIEKDGAPAGMSVSLLEG